VLDDWRCGDGASKRIYAKRAADRLNVRHEEEVLQDFVRTLPTPIGVVALRCADVREAGRIPGHQERWANSPISRVGQLAATARPLRMPDRDGG
jgi:hypothetical protein